MFPKVEESTLNLIRVSLTSSNLLLSRFFAETPQRGLLWELATAAWLCIMNKSSSHHQKADTEIVHTVDDVVISKIQE